MLKQIRILILRSIVWGCAGLLFGGILIIINELVLKYTHNYWYASLTAMSIAGIITSSYFGAIKEAFLGSIIGLMIAMGFLIYGGEYHIDQPKILLISTAIIAFAAGGFFPKKTLITDKPLAQAASGLISGLMAWPIIATLMSQTNLINNHFLLAFIGVGLSGIFYLFVSELLMSQCREWMCNLFSAPIISAVSATASSCGILLVTNTNPDIIELMNFIPNGVYGGLTAGLVGGFILMTFGMGDRNEYHI